MTAPLWVVADMLAAAAYEPSRITNTSVGGIHIDQRPATDDELRAIAELVLGGLAIATGFTSTDDPALVATDRGRGFADRWTNLAPYRTEVAA